MRYNFFNSRRRRIYSINHFKVCQPKDKSGYKSNTAANDKFVLPRMDNDGAWKFALEIMFFDFMRLFFPEVYELIDVDVKPEFKETELKDLLPGLKSKQRIVDKLVKVKYKSGKSGFLMIHIEVESNSSTYKQQQDFAARIYDYYTMISSKFKNDDIVNIGVLINSHGLATSANNTLTNVNDGKQSKQHKDFLIHRRSYPSGQELLFKFPVIHLAKWAEREDELKALARNNPFAIMVLYQLIALKYKNQNKRLNAKVQIMRLGNQYGYSPEMIRVLLYLIDWVITLPIDLQREYYKEVRIMETEVKDRFVSIYEIIGKEEGLFEGKSDMLVKLLNHKFKSISDSIIERIKSANIEQIENWSLNLVNAQTIDEVFGD